MFRRRLPGPAAPPRFRSPARCCCSSRLSLSAWLRRPEKKASFHRTQPLLRILQFEPPSKRVGIGQNYTTTFFFPGTTASGAFIRRVGHTHRSQRPGHIRKAITQVIVSPLPARLCNSPLPASDSESFRIAGFSNQAAAVPEPSTFAMLAASLAGLAGLAWKRRK